MLLLACLLQSTIWSVDSPTSFLAAEAAAQPGDLIELQPGIYEFTGGMRFDVDVGVTVTVAGGGRATIRTGDHIPQLRATGPGELLRVENLDFRELFAGFAVLGGGLSVLSGDGAVHVVECTTEFGNQARSGVNVTDANVVFRGGVFRGSALNGSGFNTSAGSGLAAQRSVVMAQGSQFIGGSGINASALSSLSDPEPSSAGGPGAVLTDARVLFADCDLIGGQGGDGILLLPGGIPAANCAAGSPGGDAIRFASGVSTVSVRASSLQPAPGGSSDPLCSPTPPPAGLYYGGPALAAATIDYSVYRFDLDAPTTVPHGTNVTFALETPPFTVPRFLAVSAQSTVGLVATLGMTSFVGPPLALVPLPINELPTQVDLFAPFLPPGVATATFVAQGVFLRAGVELSAPAVVTLR